MRKCTHIGMHSNGTDFLGLPSPGHLRLTIQENYVQYEYASIVPINDPGFNDPSTKEKFVKKVETSNQRLDYQFDLDGFTLYLYYRKDLPVE